jgi:hypothetical protein
MTMRNKSKALQVSIIAITAALFTVFFFLSFTVSVPHFTFLYLPIILLGVFPLWFGRSGLFGSIIGAFIGGVYVENLPPHFAWVEITTALIIYSLNWLLITRKAAEAKTETGIATLLGVYALSLFVGTCAILWQFSLVGLFPADLALAFLFPTFALNLPFVLITCPALIRAVSPKLRNMGVYAGSFRERRNNLGKPKS